MGLAVIGILFEETNDEYNAAADNILLQLALDKQMDAVWQNRSEQAFLSFAVSDLINISDATTNFYHYNGSLTTPPCTPAVSWHVAANPIKVRASAMDLFREKTKLWKDATGAIDADTNFRPIQSNPSCIQTCNDMNCHNAQNENNWMRYVL